MNTSYLSSIQNAVLLSKPATTIRLLLIVFFVSLFGNTINAQTTVQFTTPGTTTWVCPAGVTAIKIETWGGGEGGSGTNGSGGGGAFAGDNNLAVIPGKSYTIVVGSGGAAGSGNGTNSSIALFETPTVYLVRSIAGGTSGTNKGGLASSCTGAIKFSGGNGLNSGSALGEGGGGSGGSSGNGFPGLGPVGSTPGIGGAGGTAAVGGSAGAKGGNGANTSANGYPGNSPGGGGGSRGTSGNNSGDGGDGQVILTFNCPTTFYILSTATSSVNVCAGSSSAVTLTSDAAGLPIGTYTVNYEIQGVAQTPATMIVTTAGTGSFVNNGFTTVGDRFIKITSISSGYCTSTITANNTDTVTVLSTLAPPTLLAGSGATCSQITANWQAMVDATYYELDVSTSSTFATFVSGYNALNVGLVTTYNITGLDTGTTYYYRVRAFNGTCISQNPSAQSYATAKTPNAPTGLTTLSSGCDELKISWTAGVGATSYEVQWSTDSFSTVLGTATVISPLTYTITGLSIATYKYRIRSVNGCNSSAYVASSNTTLSNTLPTRPGSISSSGVLCNQFTVTWPAGANAISYKIEWATNSTFTTGYGSASGVTALTYTITGLSAATGYYYKVSSENGCGFSSVRSGSGTPNVTTLASAPSAPINVQTPSILCTQFTMSWTGSTGATSYTVERALDSNFTTGLVTENNVSASPYVFTGLTPGTKYYYRVRAVSCSPSAYATGTSSFVTTSASLPTAPTISASGVLTFCETSSVTLTSSSAGTGGTYLWSTGETTASIFVYTPGNYTVQVTNAAGCQSVSSAVKTVVVDGLPTATAGGSQTISSSDIATVSGTTATNGTISWTHNGYGSIANGTTATPIYTPAIGDNDKTVTLTMKVTSNNSCSPQIATATYTVIVTSRPAAPIVTKIDLTCAIPTGTITVTAISGMVYSIDGTSYTNATSFSDLAAGSYNITAKEISSGKFSNATPVTIAPLVTNKWKNGSWSTLAGPTIDQNIIFESDYTSSSDLTGCTCQVNSGVAVVISPSNTLTIYNQVAVLGSGTLTFDSSSSDVNSKPISNSGSLVQKNNTPTVANSGDIIYKRTVPAIHNTDYTYWSSPVSSQTLTGFSPQSQNKYYSFDADADDWANELPSNTMDEGNGYCIYGPKNINNSSFFGSFTGTPNNGSVEITEVKINQNYLIGNPYPSAIDADLFILANAGVIDGALYFWTHNTDPINGQYIYEDYATYNLTGGTGTKASKGLASTSVNTNAFFNANIPTGYIAAGQGFFVGSNATTITDTKIVFDNSMRVANGTLGLNSNFFKTKGNTKGKNASAIEKDRVWLNLSNDQGVFKQTLVGYITGATNDYETTFDADSYDSLDGADFYSVNQDNNLVIQGRALPFDENDTVPLGFRSSSDGNYTINIDQADGLLINQAVYLEDKLTNTVTDLKSGNYTFTTAAGTFNDRFVLKYTNKTLSIDETDKEDGILVLYSNNYKSLIIHNNDLYSTVNSVALFNITGQNIANWEVNDFEQTNIQFQIKNTSSGIYIVKVKTTKGESNKKIIIK